jgi:hypothetical protein
MPRIVLTFGLISGAILVLMFLLTIPFKDSLHQSGTGEIVGYTSMVAAFLLIYFGVRSYRDNVAGGSMSFGRAFAVGMAIMAVASACYVAAWEVIYYGTNTGTEYIAKYQESQIEKLRARGASQAEIDKEVADMQKFAELYKNPIVNVAVTFLEPLPVGLVMALISAGVLRRRRNGEAEQSLATAI